MFIPGGVQRRKSETGTSVINEPQNSKFIVKAKLECDASYATKLTTCKGELIELLLLIYLKRH